MNASELKKAVLDDLAYADQLRGRAGVDHLHHFYLTRAQVYATLFVGQVERERK